MNEIDWRYGAQHMLERHGITEAQANEAITDIDAIWFDPDPSSRSKISVRVIGYSHTLRKVLTVILVHRKARQGFWGANGWESNSTDKRRYEGRNNHGYRA